MTLYMTVSPSIGYAGPQQHLNIQSDLSTAFPRRGKSSLPKHSMFLQRGRAVLWHKENLLKAWCSRSHSNMARWTSKASLYMAHQTNCWNRVSPRVTLGLKIRAKAFIPFRSLVGRANTITVLKMARTKAKTSSPRRDPKGKQERKAERKRKERQVRSNRFGVYGSRREVRTQSCRFVLLTVWQYL